LPTTPVSAWIARVVDEVELSPTYETPVPYRAKLRPRVRTICSQDVTVVEARARAVIAKRKFALASKSSTLPRKKAEHSPAAEPSPLRSAFVPSAAATPLGTSARGLQTDSPVTGVTPLSNESLLWDNSGESLLSPTNPSRLWSSSTQFSVELPPNTEEGQSIPVIEEEESTRSDQIVEDMEGAQSLDAASRRASETQSSVESSATVRPNIPTIDECPPGGTGPDDLRDEPGTEGSQPPLAEISRTIPLRTGFESSVPS
jgi:hypothetical protein